MRAHILIDTLTVKLIMALQAEVLNHVTYFSYYVFDPMERLHYAIN